MNYYEPPSWLLELEGQLLAFFFPFPVDVPSKANLQTCLAAQLQNVSEPGCRCSASSAVWLPPHDPARTGLAGEQFRVVQLRPYYY